MAHPPHRSTWKIALFWALVAALAADVVVVRFAPRMFVICIAIAMVLGWSLDRLFRQLRAERRAAAIVHDALYRSASAVARDLAAGVIVADADLDVLTTVIEVATRAELDALMALIEVATLVELTTLLFGMKSALDTGKRTLPRMRRLIGGHVVGMLYMNRRIAVEAAAAAAASTAAATPPPGVA